MPTVLIPKYSQTQINTNFFNKRTSTSLSEFISDNYVEYNGSLNNTNLASSPSSTISLKLLNSIQLDYGNGPISNGIGSLELINKNIISGTNDTFDIFGNYIIYGGNINFSKVTLVDGVTIVLGNLQMIQIFNIAPKTLQTIYNALILNIVKDLKQGQFDAEKYTTSLLRQSRNMAKAVKTILGNEVAL